jgi:hypothetical protein
VNHAGPASVIDGDVCCFQLSRVLISFVMQRIMIRGNDSGRRNAGQIGREEWGYFRVFTVDSLR